MSDTALLTLAPTESPDVAPAPGAADEFLRDPRLRRLLATDVITAVWGPLLGQPLSREDELPELLVARSPLPRGVEPPLHRGFDREFLFFRGANPVVAIAERSPLLRSEVPIWTDTQAFDEARGTILAGALPRSEDIHPEDFLASGDYQFPLPSPGQLALRTAAGPSPFGENGAQMLLVGVQAGKSLPDARVPAHVVVAVDTSISMQRSSRLEITRQALRQVLAQMEPHDRLSIVSFSDRATVLLEAAGPQHAESILAAVAQLQEGQETNLFAGLREAAAVAVRTPMPENASRELLLLTDGLGDLPQATRELIVDMMQQTTTQGVRWATLDLGRSSQASDNLAALTSAAGGRYHLTSSAEDIGQHLAVSLNGESSWLAQEVRLHVEFNPAAVARYRLVGHAAGSGGLLPKSSPGQLRSGQTAVALYEVWLVPNGEAQIATARLEWRQANSPQTTSLSQEIGRVQFALTPAETPLPLYTAQVLAETAEVLGGSPYAPPGQPDLSHVIRYAEQANSRLRARPSYARNLELLKAAAQLQSER